MKSQVLILSKLCCISYEFRKRRMREAILVTMKLKLPVRLFRAVISVLSLIPSALYATYTVEQQVDTLADILAYTSTSDDVLFRLIEDLEISTLSNDMHGYSAGSWNFTSHSPDTLKSLIFKDNTVNLFNLSKNVSLEFLFLQDLSIARNTGFNAAISGHSNNTIAISNIKTVSVRENTTTDWYYGGAIETKKNGNLTLNNNGTVTFSENTALCDGGAIYGGEYSTITLSGNESVTFSGNSAPSGSGGAIRGNCATISLCNNDAVMFVRNTSSTASTYAPEGGGAIGGSNGTTISLSDNKTVLFSANTVYGSYFSHGGAIWGAKTTTLSNNGSVTFTGNRASSFRSAGGGAIEGSAIELRGNGAVTFSENTVSALNGYAYGGAIEGSAIELSGNENVTFSVNSVLSSDYHAYGGAIYAHGVKSDTMMLNNNEIVTFSGNLASSLNNNAAWEASGGAIYGNTIELIGNGAVSFCGNKVSGFSACGGAIYNRGNLSIRNNDSVVFEKNVEEASGTYRLRSIYAGGVDSSISLSAAEGACIEFRDSVYINSANSGSTVELNADYTDDAGTTTRQTGDIIFTGKYTEQHLNELLADVGQGRTATAEEILNSRTTEVKALTNLYGGRLRVEDGAVYKGYGISAHEGSLSTILVKDATLEQREYGVILNAGTRLQVEGAGSICGNVEIRSGAEMRVEGSVSLDGGLTLRSHKSAAVITGTTLSGCCMSGSSGRMQNVLLEAVGDAYGISGVTMESVTFSAALTTLTMSDVSFDTVCSFSVGEEGTIILSNATLCLTLPTVGNEDGIFRVDLINLFHCKVEGDLTLDLDTDSLVAAGYTGVELDFGNGANEDYSNLTLSMTGAIYEGTMGNVAGFTLASVPEPTTATLSLLALAALAARRRRK